MRALLVHTVVLLLVVLSGATAVSALELRTRYATVVYPDERLLRKFNKKLYMGKLRYHLADRKPQTVADEVAAKLDLIVEKVETALSMFPAKVAFTIELHPGRKGVAEAYRRIYKRDVNFIAFYSPSRNTVFFAVDKAKLRVAAHEIAHVVIEHYFAVSPPQKIHEVLAQFAEKHVAE